MGEAARDPIGDAADDAPRRPGPLSRAATAPLIALIWVYRATLSPLVGGQCRFEPTCSRYGEEALRRHGPIRGSVLTLRRLLRCHPLSKGGYDPPPVEWPPEDAEDRKG